MNQKRNKKPIRSEKVKEKRPLAERLGNALDIPADLLCGGCYLEMQGQNELRLQGCRKILVYTDEKMVLRLRRGCLQIMGRRLVCTSYHAGCVVIGGWITALRFCEGEGEA